MQSIEEVWKAKQNLLKKQHITHSTFSLNDITYIGGVDISFYKDNPNIACACLIILSFPDLKIVYQKCEMVELHLPYIPSFLAFREVEHLKKLVDELVKEKPNLR